MKKWSYISCLYNGNMYKKHGKRNCTYIIVNTTWSCSTVILAATRIKRPSYFFINQLLCENILYGTTVDKPIAGLKIRERKESTPLNNDPLTRPPHLRNKRIVVYSCLRATLLRGGKLFTSSIRRARLIWRRRLPWLCYNPWPSQYHTQFVWGVAGNCCYLFQIRLRNVILTRFVKQQNVSDVMFFLLGTSIYFCLPLKCLRIHIFPEEVD